MASRFEKYKSLQLHTTAITYNMLAFQQIVEYF